MARLRAQLHGLSITCPFDQCNPSDCVLCEIRKLPNKARFEWVESLNLDELDTILRTHYQCLGKKETEDQKRYAELEISARKP